jgi:hypothetical protein
VASAQSALVKDVLKAAFQVHAALAQKRFARLALDGTGGTMKSFAQRGAQSFLAAPGNIGVPDDRAHVEGINRKIRGLLASAFGFHDHDFLKLRLYALHEAKFKVVG